MTALRFRIILYMITNLFGSVGSAGRRRGSHSGTCVVAEGDDLGNLGLWLLPVSAAVNARGYKISVSISGAYGYCVSRGALLDPEK